ncbi:uncharacterized protein LOC111616262 [Centruroides sculpturatus]|uniref:uncharacterized protein LOC111616262 n=1 Tax=Centruroides sculpturatus TaxID=218467 RepID=UPI000C6EFFCB|nr:uncharacterized protein LOC111616262 [Centruroides sculpturatus]
MAYFTICDYQTLFPSIKLEPCFCELRDFLLEKVEGSYKYLPDVLDLSHLMVHSSFFKYEGVTYMQTRGVPMGSPISGILCELVIRKHENTILPKFQEDIALSVRYINDVLIIWNKVPNIDLVLNYFNDNPYGLSLKVEQESQTTVHFLDITIKMEQGHLSTCVFRKESYTPLFIHNSSHDPYSYKVYAFLALVKRVHTHCLEQKEKENKLLRIKNALAMQQGYPSSLVKHLINQYINRRERNMPQDEQMRVITNNKIFSNIYRDCKDY